jgi:4-hydroxy-tetrahydrodipicolinate synthase
MNAPFGRLLTAMVTPFTADGALDLTAAAELATHLVDAGNDGLVISGTTGESPTTSDDEQDALLRAVIEAVGERAHVVAGVGTNDTAHTIELARHAEKAGAAGVLVVTPYYSKPPQAGLLNHFRLIADATELPVMLYDIPGRSVVPIETATLIALADHPRIVAVKDAKGDPFATTQVLAATDLAFYSGDDANALPWFAMGAVGLVGVATHVCTKEYVEMIAAVDAGDLATARRLNAKVAPAVRGIMTVTQGAIAAKAALQLLGVLSQRTTRPPLIDATDEEIATLRTELKAAGLPV